MEKLSAFWDLFRKGQCIDNPAAWKKGQIAAPVLGAFLMAAVHLLGLYGYTIPIDEGTAAALAGGILIVVNSLLTVITTDKLGILPAKPILQSAQPATATGMQAGPVIVDQANQGNNDPLGPADRG